MGHAEGFLNTYAGFTDHIVDSTNGPEFVGATFTALLNADEEHTSNTAYPDDLMNDVLQPSERRLPSPLDIEIIQTARATVLPLPVVQTASMAGSGPIILSATDRISNAASGSPSLNPAADGGSPPLGITNGTFTIPSPSDPLFG